jgi:hypothetical protein
MTTHLQPIPPIFSLIRTYALIQIPLKQKSQLLSTKKHGLYYWIINALFEGSSIFIKSG